MNKQEIKTNIKETEPKMLLKIFFFQTLKTFG